MSFMEPIALPAGLSTPTTARPMSARMRAMQRRCALPPPVREAWPTAKLECEVAGGRTPAYSGRYL